MPAPTSRPALCLHRPISVQVVGRGAHEDDGAPARARRQGARPGRLHQHDQPGDQDSPGHRRLDGHRQQLSVSAHLAATDLGPNGRAVAQVEALLPGPDGNARAGTVTRVEGPLSLSVAVSNDAGFGGGTTAPQPVVTEEDKTRLQAQLFEELKKQAFDKLVERDVKGKLHLARVDQLPAPLAFVHAVRRRGVRRPVPQHERAGRRPRGRPGRGQQGRARRSCRRRCPPAPG